jgi:hypothetical protein
MTPERSAGAKERAGFIEAPEINEKNKMFNCSFYCYREISIWLPEINT